jgi:hypothetical protein
MKSNSSDKIREKIDGFSLNNTNDNNLENRYITTDQGVYSQPDDNYKAIKEDKKLTR